MAKRKLAPNRGKHSSAKEAEESSLQLGALTSARDSAPPFAPDAAENTAPSSPKNTAPSSPKNTASALAKNTATSSALDKNKGSASAKNKASASAENAVAFPAAYDEDQVSALPQDTKLRIFINFLREKAASMSLRGLLDAFLAWVHSSAGDDTSDASSVESSEEKKNVAEEPTKGSDHQEQREKRYLKGTKNTQQQASPQLPEERRHENHAYIYDKAARHRNGHDCDKIEAHRSVPTGLSISQHERDFNQAEANRVIPAGPSISEIVEDSQKFDRYLSSDIHKDYIKIMSNCPLGKEVCAFCYFERDVKTQRSQSQRILHIRQRHNNLAGVKCANCPARFPTEGIRNLHGMYCNS